MIGLYLPLLSGTLWAWVGSTEIELVPVSLVCGASITLLRIFDILMTSIQLGRNSRTQRVRKHNQLIVDWIILRFFGITRSIRTRSFTKQQHITVNLARFFLKLPLDRISLQQIEELDSSDLILIEEVESSLGFHDYLKAIQSLNQLSENYGMNPWIYSRLRKCYLELDDLDGLEKINFQTGSDVKVLEVQIKRLLKELNNTSDLKAKRTVFENIYKIAPHHEVTEQYFRLLHASGEYDLALRLIRTSWSDTNSIQIGRIVLEILSTNKSKLKLSDFVNSLPIVNSYGYELLKMHVQLSLGEVSKAKTIALEVFQQNELIGSIFQLELSNMIKDTKLFSDALNSILNTKLSQEKTVGLNA